MLLLLLLLLSHEAWSRSTCHFRAQVCCVDFFASVKELCVHKCVCLLIMCLGLGGLARRGYIQGHRARAESETRHTRDLVQQKIPLP